VPVRAGRALRVAPGRADAGQGAGLMPATVVPRTDAKALTRRGFLAGTGTAATLLSVAACGAGPGAKPVATRTASSVHGPVVVPAQPKRVVTLDGFTMAALFDLGLRPVGVYSAGEQYVEPQFLRGWRAITKISDGTVGGAVDLEKVAALRPDLI